VLRETHRARGGCGYDSNAEVRQCRLPCLCPPSSFSKLGKAGVGRQDDRRAREQRHTGWARWQHLLQRRWVAGARGRRAQGHGKRWRRIAWRFRKAVHGRRSGRGRRDERCGTQCAYAFGGFQHRRAERAPATVGGGCRPGDGCATHAGAPPQAVHSCTTACQGMPSPPSLFPWQGKSWALERDPYAAPWATSGIATDTALHTRPRQHPEPI